MWTRQRQRDEQIEETSLGWDTQRQPERERKQEKQGNKTIDEHIKHNKSKSKRTRRDETRRDVTWRDVTWRDVTWRRDAVTRQSHDTEQQEKKRGHQNENETNREKKTRWERDKIKTRLKRDCDNKREGEKRNAVWNTWLVHFRSMRVHILHHSPHRSSFT
jgi:hypothetical protein